MKINPCQCGGQGFVAKDDLGYYIQCDRCGKRTLYYKTMEDATRTWNNCNRRRTK